MFASTVSASLIAYGFRAFQSGWTISFTWVAFILSCIFWYLGLYRRQILRRSKPGLEARVLSSMSSASYISHYSRHMGFRLQPAEWNCSRCSNIIRKKRSDAYRCKYNDQGGLERPRRHHSRVGKEWADFKAMAGSLLVTGPSGLALALERIYSLRLGVLIPALFAVQVMSILLVSNLHSDWYKNCLSSGLELPLLSYTLQYLGVFSVRFLAWQIGLVSDPLIQSFSDYQESWYDRTWPKWRDYRPHAIAMSLGIAAFTMGFEFWTEWNETESESDMPAKTSQEQLHTHEQAADWGRQFLQRRRLRSASLLS